MPYITTWVKPEVFMVHKGVSVYRVYEGDECENEDGVRSIWAMRYWYRIADEPAFMVHQLSTWKPEYTKHAYGSDGETKSIISAISDAIDSGELKVP